MKDEILPLLRDVFLVCDESHLLGGTLFALDGSKVPSNALKEWSGKILESEAEGRKDGEAGQGTPKATGGSRPKERGEDWRGRATIESGEAAGMVEKEGKTNWKVFEGARSQTRPKLERGKKQCNG
jgi:hypothetical protein